MAAILKIYFSPPELKGQLTGTWLGSFGMTCRLKKAKIVPIGNPRWPHGIHLENPVFASPPEQKGQLTRNLVGSIGVTVS